MIYYVDGYNLLFSGDFSLDNLSFDREQCLQEFYETIKPFSISVVIVFDAYKQVGAFSRVDYHDIEIVYTAFNQKADDFIVEAVQLSKEPHQTVVVTNDRELSRNVVLAKGRAIKLAQFFSLLKSPPKKNQLKSGVHQFNELDFEYYARVFIERSGHD